MVPMLRCGLVRTNWLLAIVFSLAGQKIRLSQDPGPVRTSWFSAVGGGRFSSHPPPRVLRQQEEGRLRAPVKSTDVHAAAPDRPRPDRYATESARNMVITVGVNAAVGNGYSPRPRRRPLLRRSLLWGLPPARVFGAPASRDATTMVLAGVGGECV